MRLRTIVEEVRVELIIDAAVERYERLDEIIKGLKWRLARTPEIGFHFEEDGKTYCIFKEAPIPELNLAGVRVIYQYDSHCVHLINIDILPASPPPDPA